MWDHDAERRRAWGVADKWKISAWGEQLGRQTATGLGHMPGGTGWPRRLLDWWPAQADETAWLLRGRCGDRAHPTIAAACGVTAYAAQWAAAHRVARASRGPRRVDTHVQRLAGNVFAPASYTFAHVRSGRDVMPLERMQAEVFLAGA